MSWRDAPQHISFRREEFRMEFGTLLQAVTVGALIASEAYFLLSTPLDWGLLLLVVPGTVILLCVPMVLAICLLFRFEVGPDGIDCFILNRHVDQADWSDVVSASTVRMFGLDYLLVKTSRRRRTLWIPLFVPRYELLRDLLVRYAPHERSLDQKLTAA